MKKIFEFYVTMGYRNEGGDSYDYIMNVEDNELIKQLIFDFDGTIVDSSALAVQILNELAEKYHFKKVTMEDVHILKTAPVRERFKRIGLPLYLIPKMSVDCMMMYHRELHALKPFDGIKDLMHYLKNEGFSLSVISSNSVENISHFVKDNDLEVFDHIISAKNLFGKDQSIKRFMKQNHLTSNETLYVGDEIRDIEACKKIPVKIIAVTWGFDPLSLLKSGSPDYIVDTPEEILKIVKGIQTESK